jgi:alkanesulfonate monooxygenase SsuD/methylene tetrahydromethanopterin reductase-like flavin-dependent oxidoreductase (luciferase family)
MSGINQQEETDMLKYGVSMFFTDYSMAPAELGRALEQRGFESVWAPEHSHIPLSRKSPFPQEATCRRNTTTPWTRS